MVRRKLTRAEMAETLFQFAIYLQFLYDESEQGLMKCVAARESLKDYGFEIRNYHLRPSRKKKAVKQA